MMFEWFPNLTAEQIRNILDHFGEMFNVPDEDPPEPKVEVKKVYKRRCASCGQFLKRHGAYAHIGQHGACHLKQECLEKGLTKLSRTQIEAFIRKEQK